MSKEIIKTNTQISELGREILDDIRKGWGKVKVKREVSAPDPKKPGHFTFVEREFLIDAPIKRLNENVPATVFYHFVDLVKPDERERVTGIIKAGTFEVEKALQAFEKAPLIALDRKIKPTTWAEADQLGSPSIATLVKYKGEEKAVDLIHLMCVQFAKKFGRRNDMSDEDLKEFAEDVVLKYRALTIADLKAIFFNTLTASKNRFNLDYQGMMQVIDQNYHNRLEYSAKKSQREHFNIPTIGREEKRQNLSEGMSLKEQGEILKAQFPQTSKPKE